MSDLISRQAAIDAIEEYADRLQMVDWKENPGVPYKAYALNWCINTIRDLPSAQPTVDAVPVIRCKDCKYWYAGENINYCRKFWDDDGEPKLYRCTADDFCSRAERKEE